MTSEQPYPCCDKMNGPAWIDGRYCRPVCEVHGYQTEPEARQHQTSELRPALAVWADALVAQHNALQEPNGRPNQAAAAVIEAYGDEREAKGRAEQAAELAKYKALAETLAGALGLMVSSTTGTKVFGGDGGTFTVSCPSAQALKAASEALRQYKEARDAS